MSTIFERNCQYIVDLKIPCRNTSQKDPSSALHFMRNNARFNMVVVLVGYWRLRLTSYRSVSDCSWSKDCVELDAGWTRPYNGVIAMQL